MGRATILSKISTFILTGGRRTTASGTRDVLTEMADSYVSAIYDTAANFTSTNPILETKQHGVETDDLTTSPKFKIGDGVTAWNDLPYTGGLSILNSTYMLTGIASDISGYDQAVSLNNFVVGGLNINLVPGVSTTPTILQEFATNLGFPNTTIIPAGTFTFHFETKKSAGSNNYYCYAELYKRNLAGNETLLITSDNSSQSAVNTNIQHTLGGFSTVNIPILSTDRLVVKIYAVMVSSTATISLFTDDNTDARFVIPSAYIGGGDFVKKGTITSNTILKGSGTDAATNSKLSDDGVTITVNSTTDGESSGNDNFSHKTTTGGYRIGYYVQTGFTTLIEFYTNNVKNSMISDFVGFFKISAKNRFSITNFTTGLTKFWTEMSSGYSGFGNDYFVPNERVEIRNGNLRINDLTASQIVATDASKNLQTLPVATYPSLTELTYVKGVTSSIQTQLNDKLTASNNLSDLTNVSTARNNLKEWDLRITTGNQSTTSNVATNITDLVSQTLTINKLYDFEGHIYTGCNNTGGVKFQITIPSGATMVACFDGSIGTNATFQSALVTTSATLTTFNLIQFNGTNIIKVKGQVLLGGTAGTIQFGFASGTNTHTSTVYQLGTHITLRQLD